MITEALAREAMTRDGRDPGDAYWHVVREASAWEIGPRDALSGELYGLVLASPSAARSYISRQAVVEHVGAATISAIGRKSEDKDLRGKLRRHALDEARHARMLRQVLRDRFSSDVDQGFVRRALAAHHAFVQSFDGNFHRFVCDTHAAEIRTLRKLHHMEAACDGTNPTLAEQLRPVLAAIVLDEIDHIAYTAMLIGEWIDRGIIDRELLATSIMVYDVKEWDEIGIMASAIESAGLRTLAERVQRGAETRQAA